MDSSKNFSIKDLEETPDSLKKLQKDAISLSDAQRNSQIRKIVSIFLKSLTEKSEEENEELSLKMIQFVLSVSPSIDSVIELFYEEKNIFLISLLFSYARGHKITYIPKNMITYAMKLVSERPSPDSETNYFKDQFFDDLCDLPYLLERFNRECLDSQQFSDIISDILKDYPEKVTRSLLEFCSNLVNSLYTGIQQGSECTAKEHIQVLVRNLIGKIKDTPQEVIRFIFTTWLSYTHQAFGSLTKNPSLVEQTSIVTDSFNSVSLWKDAPIYKCFPVSEVIKMMDSVTLKEIKFKMVPFLVECVSQIVAPPEDYSGLLTKFTKQFTLKINDKDDSYFYFFIQNLINKGKTIIDDLKTIAARNYSKQYPGIITRKDKKVTFDQQTFIVGSSCEIDKDMNTVIEEEYYPTLEEARKAYREDKKLFNKKLNQYRTYSVLLYAAYSCLISIVNLHEIIVHPSTNQFIITIIRHIMQSLFDTSNAELCLNISQDNLESSDSIFIAQPGYSFSDIFQKFVVLINSINEKYIHYYSSEIALLIYENIMDGKLTYKTADFICNIPSFFLIKTTPVVFVSYHQILKCLFEKFWSCKEIFNSISHEKAENHLHAFMLMVRVSQMTVGNVYKETYMQFKNYFSSMLENFIHETIGNISRCVNQDIALRAVKYAIIVQRNCILSNESPFTNIPFNKILISAPIKSLQPQAQLELLNIIYLAKDQDSVVIKHFIGTIKYALNTNTPKYIEAAARILANSKIEDSLAEKEVNEIYKLLYKKIGLVSDSTKEILIKKIYSHLPVLFEKDEINSATFWEIDGVKIDIYRFIHEIFDNIGYEDEDLFDSYNILKALFDIAMRKNANEEGYFLDIFVLLLQNLLKMTRYIIMEKDVEEYIKLLVNTFVQLCIENEHEMKYLMILFTSLIMISSISNSCLSKDAMKYAGIFIGAVNESIDNKEFFQRLLNELPNLFVPNIEGIPLNSFKFFGYTLLTAHVPELFTEDIIEDYLKSTEDYTVWMKDKGSILQKGISNILKADKNNKIRSSFVQTAFNLLSTKEYGLHMYIIEGMKKAGMPIKFDPKDLNSLNFSSLSVKYQTVCSIISCKITGRISLTENIRQTFNNLVESKFEGMNQFEALLKKIFVLKVYLTNDATKEILNKCDFRITPLISKELIQGCVSTNKQISKLAKSTIKTISLMNDTDSPVKKDFIGFCLSPEKLFIFFSQKPERLLLFKRLASIFPTRVPEKVFPQFFNAYFEYTQYPTSKKMQHIISLKYITKFFTIRKYMETKDVSRYLEEKSQYGITNFAKFIQCTVKLFNDNDIPFSRIIKNNIIEFILFHLNTTTKFFTSRSTPDILSEQPDYTIFFAEIMKADKSKSIALTFFKALGNTRIFHIRYLEVVRLLFKDGIFNNENFFKTTIHNLLKDLISQSSNGNWSDKPSGEFTRITALAEIDLELMKNELEELETSENKEDISVDENQLIEKITDFMKLFNYSFFIGTQIYNNFIEAFIANSDDFVFTLFNHLVNKENPLMTKKNHIWYKSLMKNTIKKMKNSEIDKIWKTLIKQDTRYKGEILDVVYCIAKNIDLKENQYKALIKLLSSNMYEPSFPVQCNAFRIAAFLVKNKRLPDEMVESVITLIFSDITFIEKPFIKYIITILKEYSSYLTENHKIVQIITRFVIKCISNDKDSIKLVVFLQNVPELVDLLPTNPILTLTYKIDSMIPSIVYLTGDQIYLIKSLLNYANNVEKDEEIVTFIANTFYKLCVTLVNNSSSISDIILLLTTTVINHKCKINGYYRNTIFEVELKPDTFPLVVATLVGGNIELFLDKLEYIDKTIQYCFDYMNFLNPIIFDAFFNFLENSGTLKERFLMIYYTMLHTLLESMNTFAIPRFILLAEQFISSSAEIDSCVFLRQVWDFYRGMKEEDKLKVRDSMLDFLCGSLIHIHKDSQIEYINLLYEYSLIDNRCLRETISTIPEVISSKTMEFSTKKYIIDLFCQIEDIDDYESLLLVFNGLQTIRKETGDFSLSLQLKVLILIIETAPHNVILETLDQFDKLLKSEETVEEKALALMNEIPEFWTDRRFSKILLICFRQKSPFWALTSLFARELSDSIIEDVGIELFSSIASNESGVLGLTDFLTKISGRYNAGRIIRTALYALKDKTVKINEELLIILVKKGNCRELLPYFCDFSCLDTYSFVNEANGDFLLQLFLESPDETKPTSKEVADVALYALEQYNTVEKFIEEDTQFFEHLSRVNSQFCIKEAFKDESVRDVFFIDSIGAESTSDFACNLMNSERDDNAFNSATQQLAKCFSKLKFLSRIDREKLAALAVSCTISNEVTKETSQQRLRSSRRLKVFFSPPIYKSIFAVSNGVFTDPSDFIKQEVFEEKDTEEDKAPCMFVPNEMSDLCSSVLGYTNTNFLSVSNKETRAMFNKCIIKMKVDRAGSGKLCEFLFMFLTNSFSVNQLILCLDIYSKEIKARIAIGEDITELKTRVVILIKMVLETLQVKRKEKQIPNDRNSYTEIRMRISLIFDSLFITSISYWKDEVQYIAYISHITGEETLFEHLFTHYKFLSYAAAIELGNAKILEAIKKMNTSHNALLNIENIMGVFDAISGVDFNEIKRQEAVLNYANCIKSGEEDEEILNDLFNRICFDDREMCNEKNIQELLKPKKSNPISVTQKVCESEKPIHFFIDSLNSQINGLNRNCSPKEIGIDFVYNRFEIINNNIVAFDVICKGVNKKLYLISIDTVHLTRASYMATLLGSVDTTFNAAYSTHVRSFSLSAFPITAIGKNLAFSIMSNSDAFSLSSVLDHNYGKDAENLTEFDNTLVKKKFMSLISESLTPMGYISSINSLRNSFACESFIRFVSNAKYPSPSDVILSRNSSIVNPISVIERKSDESNESSFRMSPNLLNLFGPSMESQMIIGLSACANAMLSSYNFGYATLESIVMLQSEMNVNEAHEDVISRLSFLSPPCGPVDNIEEKEITEWIENVDSLIKTAEVAENQPKDSLPWF